MKAGFGRVDITPRLGVEMAGFGAYLHRVARELRDRLYARAMAVDDGRDRWVLVSVDLLGVEASTVAEARSRIAKVTGLAERQIMLHATHTHSAPATSYSVGWGEQDAPYMERLPMLMARAACEAMENLQEAEFAHAVVPAEHISYNRDLEDRPQFEDALKEDWQPRFPDRTERQAHVIRVRRGGRLLGFVSSFSCHPVVCCEATYSLHGDYAGVATNIVEMEHPGCVGMFLQGGHGDQNTAVCHATQERSMHGLNVIAGRYARVLRAGLDAAGALSAAPLAALQERVMFRRAVLTEEQLQAEIAAARGKVLAVADDASPQGRMDMVRLAGLRRVLAHLQASGRHEEALEMQALRLGDLTILGTPFELYLGIKERLCREAGGAPLLVLSTTNGSAGYAVTRARFESADYGAAVVPLILGICPFTADLEDEIVEAGVNLVRRLKRES